MARAALRLARADVAVAVSGIAGPGGAVARQAGRHRVAMLGKAPGRALRLTSERRHFLGNRESVRRKTVRLALSGLIAR